MKMTMVNLGLKGLIKKYRREFLTFHSIMVVICRRLRKHNKTKHVYIYNIQQKIKYLHCVSQAVLFLHAKCRYCHLPLQTFIFTIISPKAKCSIYIVCQTDQNSIIKIKSRKRTFLIANNDIIIINKPIKLIEGQLLSFYFLQILPFFLARQY